MRNSQRLGIAGLVALALSSQVASAKQLPTSSIQKPIVCDPKLHRLELKSLKEITLKADGYQGLNKPYGKKDGKLDAGEYVRYNIDFPIIYFGATQPSIEERILLEEEIKEDLFRVYDVDRDEFLTPKDDLNKDGVIDCKDVSLYSK